LRSQQTAAPLIARYPDVPVEQWPIQEFTYLSPEHCHNTTFSERKPLVVLTGPATILLTAMDQELNHLLIFCPAVTAVERIKTVPDKFVLSSVTASSCAP